MAPLRIVRNKAAENAKHIIPGTHSPVSQATSVISSHAAPTGHDTALQRSGSYSINGILGIPQPHTDPNGNINKRKRDDNGECELPSNPFSCCFLVDASVE